LPIYKVGNTKKDGLQKYNVRINYISDDGKAKQLTRAAYGIDNAKNLERELQYEVQTKGENSVKKMTIKQLFDEYIKMKKYEVRESTLDKTSRILNLFVISDLSKIRIDKLSVKVLQEWKISVEEREGKKLALTTKRNVYGEFRAMLNFAVRMEYLPKNPLLKIGNFKDSLLHFTPDCEKVKSTL